MKYSFLLLNHGKSLVTELDARVQRRPVKGGSVSLQGELDSLLRSTCFGLDAYSELVVVLGRHVSHCLDVGLTIVGISLDHPGRTKGLSACPLSARVR